MHATDVADMTDASNVVAAPRERIVRSRDVLVLLAVSMLAAVAAVGLPLLAGSDVRGLQVAVAAAGLAAFAAATMVRNALTVALAAVVIECVLAMPGTDFPVVVVPMAGVAALTAAEGFSLAQMWRSRGMLTVATEQPHVRASLERVATGAAAAAVVSAIGWIELPSTAVVVALGTVALGAVVWTLARTD